MSVAYSPDPSMTEKVCKRCGAVRPVALFYKDKRYRDGYQPWCKPCYAEYRNQPTEKAKQRERHLKRYANPAVRKAHREKSNAYFRQRWHSDADFRERKNKQTTVKNHRRRAQKKQLRGRFTLAEWNALCARYGHKCLCCGRSDVKLTADHILPLSRGGSNSIDNIQCLCKTCNNRKMTRVIDYRPDKGGTIYKQLELF